MAKANDCESVTPEPVHWMCKDHGILHSQQGEGATKKQKLTDLMVTLGMLFENHWAPFRVQ